MNDKRLTMIYEDLLELIDQLEEAGEDNPELTDKINEIIDILTDASDKLEELEQAIFR